MGAKRFAWVYVNDKGTAYYVKSHPLLDQEITDIRPSPNLEKNAVPSAQFINQVALYPINKEENMPTPQWIWYPGDFEIHHALKLSLRLASAKS